jgi:hypothetical protein
MMSSEQLTILQCAMLLKAALGTRSAARFLRRCEVPVTIAVMVLAHSAGYRRPPRGPGDAIRDACPDPAI